MKAHNARPQCTHVGEDGDGEDASDDARAPEAAEAGAAGIAMRWMSLGRSVFYAEGQGGEGG